MKKKKLYHRQKAKKGSGRTVKTRPIQVPVEVHDLFLLYKIAYAKSLKSGTRITSEQVLRRWMDNIGRLDPEVKQYVLDIIREKQQPVASPSPISSPEKRNELFFVCEGRKIKAHPGYRSPFYANLDGNNVGFSTLINNGWHLIDQDGIEINTLQDAWKKNSIIQSDIEE